MRNGIRGDGGESWSGGGEERGKVGIEPQGDGEDEGSSRGIEEKVEFIEIQSP